MSNAGMFVGLDTALSGGLDDLLQSVTASYSAGVAGLFVGGMTLYVIWMGYQTLAGKLQRPIEDVVWDLARMTIILAFITNADGYLDATTAAINGMRDGFSGNDSVWALMDTVWSTAQEVGAHLYKLDDSDFVKAMGLLAEALVWGGTLFMVLVSTTINMMAEITLKLMTATAPIFLGCLAFGWLRPMFNNWCQTIFSAILTVLFSALSMRLAINFYNGRLAVADTGADISNIITLGAECCCIGIGSGIFIYITAQLADKLAGASVNGAAQGMARMAGSKAAGAAGKAAAKGGALAGKGLAKLGQKAYDNLKSTPSPKAASKAAVEKMKGLNK